MKGNNIKRTGLVFDYKELRKDVMYVTVKTMGCCVLFKPINDMY
jgi:hypothetical protein